MTGWSADELAARALPLSLLALGMLGQAVAAHRRAPRSMDDDAPSQAWRTLWLPLALAAPPAFFLLSGPSAASTPVSRPFAFYAWPAIGAPALATLAAIGLATTLGRAPASPGRWASAAAIVFGAIAALTAIAGRLGFFEGQALLAMSAAFAWVLSLRADEKASANRPRASDAISLAILALATLIACVGAQRAGPSIAAWGTLATGWILVVALSGRCAAIASCIGAAFAWSIGLGLWLVVEGFVNAWRQGRAFAQAELPATYGAGQAILERPSTGGFTLLFPEAAALLALPALCWAARRSRVSAVLATILAIAAMALLMLLRWRSLPV